MIKKIALCTSGPLQTTRAPGALAFMAGVCEKHQVDYEVFDLNIEFLKTHGANELSRIYEYVALDGYKHQVPIDPVLHGYLVECSRKICGEIKAQGFDSLALSVLTFYQHYWTETFLKNVREICPDLAIIIGGPGVATTHDIVNGEKISFGRYLCNTDTIDAFVLGEGDVLFEKFLLGTAQGSPGFNTRDTIDSWQPQLDDLDATALPSYKKVDFDNYWNLNDKPVVTITASRGCVRRCTFCDIGHFWKKFRFRSGARIVEEIYKSYSEMGVTDFWFNDSLMNGSYKQFFDFLESLHNRQAQDSGFAQIKYSGQLILRNRTAHSEKMYELLGATGGTFFQVGIESGSERVRDHMQKKFSNDDIYYHYEMCERHRISNWIFMTVGYPTETEQDFQETLDLYTNLQKYLINGTILGTNVPTIVTILENTPLADMMTNLNLEWIHDELSVGQWQSRDAQGLNVRKKLARYAKLLRHVMDLGYTLPVDSAIKVEHSCKYLHNNSKSKKIMPISPINSSMLS